MKFIRSITVLGMDSTDLKAALDTGKLVAQTNVSSADNGNDEVSKTKEKSSPKLKRRKRQR